MAPLDDVGHTLLAAADRLLLDEGVEALTVRRIATEAGLSTMNVYSRFGSKDGVVQHLYVKGFGLLGDEMRAVPVTDDPLEDLRGCGDAYRRFALVNTAYYALLFERSGTQAEKDAQVAEIGQATLGVLASRLQRAMDHGVMARRDSHATAALVWSVVHGVVSLELKGVGPDDVDWLQVHRDALELVIRGLAP